MSWIEKIRTDLVIQTGDGREYRPLWKNPGKQIEWNVSEFLYADVEGTHVDRRKRKGRRYKLEIYFQGEDHLDQGSAFERSADDVRPWIVSHPYYDRLTVQPLKMTVDHRQANVSKYTVDLLETIVESNPQANINPSDQIDENKEESDEAIAQSFASNVELTSSDKALMEATNTVLFDSAKTTVPQGEASEDFFNAINTASSEILNATSEPLAAMRSIQTVVNAPALFQISVQNRFKLLKNQFKSLRRTLPNALTPNLKRIYESTAGTLMSAFAIAAINPLNGDYENRSSVIDIIQSLVGTSFEENTIGVYDQYVLDLNGLQTENSSSPDSYIPDPNNLIGLDTLIRLTVSSLFQIANGARQEREIYLDCDSNIINLTHRFFGLQADDSTITQFIEINDIGINELLQIKKGRKLVYYI